MRKIQDIKKRRIGETNIATNGQKMTIIDYRGNRDIDVKFEDGTIVRNKFYKCFKNGSIRNPDYRVGEIITYENGRKAVIKRYRSCMDIDIEFEDNGTILKHKRYHSFVQSDKCNKLLSNRIGESVTASNGQTMTIIEYRASNDIDVKFSDNTVVTNRTYRRFKQGWIKNPNFKKK